MFAKTKSTFKERKFNIFFWKYHLAFHWRVDDGQTLNADFSGDLDQNYLETLYFCDFSRGGGGSGSLPPPSGSAHESCLLKRSVEVELLNLLLCADQQ